jgi:hypothetical protein
LGRKRRRVGVGIPGCGCCGGGGRRLPFLLSLDDGMIDWIAPTLRTSG